MQIRILAVVLIAGIVIGAGVAAGAGAGAKAEEADPKSAFYDPVEKQVEGWTLAVDPRLLAAENKEVWDQALVALANHLQRIKYILPEDRVKQLQALRIWIELDNDRLTSMQYHPDADWLKRMKHDPRLVKHVHIPIARELYAQKTWAKHPYVVLHELAHAYHDQVLGFDERDILAAYESAVNGGGYDEVLAHSGKKVRHYALTTHKEYFAEATEAYLGVNDFYPFVRAELKAHDPRLYEIMQKVWGELPGAP